MLNDCHSGVSAWFTASHDHSDPSQVKTTYNSEYGHNVFNREDCMLNTLVQ